MNIQTVERYRASHWFVVLCAAFFTYFSNFNVGYGFGAADLFLFLVVVSIIVVSRVHLTQESFLVISGAFLIATGLVLGSLFFSQRIEGIYQPLRYLFTIFLLTVLFSFLGQLEIKRFFQYVFFSICSLALAGILVYLDVFSGAFISGSGVDSQRLSLWYGVNRLGSILALGALLTVGLYVAGQLSARNCVIALVILLFALSATMSLGGIATVIVGIGVIVLGSLVFCKAPAKRKSLFVVVFMVGSVLFVSLGAMLTSYSLPSRYNSRIIENFESFVARGELRDFGSADTRVRYIVEAVRYIQDSPIVGIGAGQRYDTAIYPHTLPVLLQLEGGLVSLSGYLLLFVVAIYFMFLKSGNTTYRPVYFAVITWTFVTSLLHGHMYQIDHYAVFLGALFFAAKRSSGNKLAS